MKKDKIEQAVQILIAEGKIYEALEYLSNYVKNIDRYLENDLLLQMAFYNRNQRDFQNNLISKADHDMAIAKINYAIVQIVEKLPANGNDVECGKIENIHETDPVRKILFLTANPKDSTPLRLEEELRKVKDELSKTTARDSFKLISESAVKVSTITLAMQKHNPEILHFSGHGTGSDGIVVEDENGNKQLLPTNALDRMFKLFKEQVKCVLLNACYSKEQAKVISKHGIYVIGMNDAIGDKAAIDFAVGFYQSLGEKNEFTFAYEIAMVNISPNFYDSDIPEMWFDGEKISS